MPVSDTHSLGLGLQFSGKRYLIRFSPLILFFFQACNSSEQRPPPLHSLQRSAQPRLLGYTPVPLGVPQVLPADHHTHLQTQLPACRRLQGLVLPPSQRLAPRARDLPVRRLREIYILWNKIKPQQSEETFEPQQQQHHQQQ